MHQPLPQPPPPGPPPGPPPVSPPPRPRAPAALEPARATPAPDPTPACEPDARAPARARPRAPSARRVDGVVRWIDAQRLAGPMRTAAVLPSALASGELLCALVQHVVPAARLAPVHRGPRARALCAANAENALGVLWRGGRCRSGVLRAYGAAAGGAPAAQAAAALVCEVFDAYAIRDLRRREAAIARRVDAALVAGGGQRLGRPVAWARAFRDGARLLALAGPGAAAEADPVASAFSAFRRRRVPVLWENPRAFRARADDDLVLAQLDLLVTEGSAPKPAAAPKLEPAKRSPPAPAAADDPEDGQWELFRHRLLARRGPRSRRGENARLQ